MSQHSYKQLEDAYQRGVNKEHKLSPARMHPMSSQQAGMVRAMIHLEGKDGLG